MDKKPGDKLSGTRTALKYSGMAFEMMVITLVGWWLGKQIDKYFEFQKPVFTIILILVFCFISLWRVFNSLNNDKK